MPTHKSHEQEGVLHDAARSIGTALGNLSAKAGELTDDITETAKGIHMPSLPTAHEAKSAVTRLFSRNKKKAVKKTHAAKKAVKKAVKKAAAKVKAKVKPKAKAKAKKKK